MRKSRAGKQSRRLCSAASSSGRRGNETTLARPRESSKRNESNEMKNILILFSCFRSNSDLRGSRFIGGSAAGERAQRPALSKKRLLWKLQVIRGRTIALQKSKLKLGLSLVERPPYRNVCTSDDVKQSLHVFRLNQCSFQRSEKYTNILPNARKCWTNEESSADLPGYNT